MYNTIELKEIEMKPYRDFLKREQPDLLIRYAALGRQANVLMPMLEKIGLDINYFTRNSAIFSFFLHKYLIILYNRI